MIFINSRKLVISALTASVVLTSASGFLSLFAGKSIARDFDNNEAVNQSASVSNSIDGDWLLNWKANGFSHKGKLSIIDNKGTLTVEFKKKNQALNTVQQDVSVKLSKASNKAIEIVGTNHINPDDGTPKKNYTADRFIVKMIEEAEEEFDKESVDFSASAEENEIGFTLENCEKSKCVPVTVQAN